MEGARFFKILVIKVKTLLNFLLHSIDSLNRIHLIPQYILNFTVFYVKVIIIMHIVQFMQSVWLYDFVRKIFRMYLGLDSLSAPLTLDI